MKNVKNDTADCKVKIIPLGGLEQIGMNMTAIEYGDSIIVMDCGLAFPSDDMLGIDLVIPDVTYLKDNYEKVKGFVITHGHEDHIGALPYVLKMVNAPVYATKLTMGLIDHKLEENNMLRSVKRKVVKHGQSINLGCFRVEFIKMNHSIEDAAALAVFTPAGIILNTGDFKIDYTPVFGDVTDLQRLAELGKKGVPFSATPQTRSVLDLPCPREPSERPLMRSLRSISRTVSLLRHSLPTWTVSSRLSIPHASMAEKSLWKAAAWSTSSELPRSSDISISRMERSWILNS